MPFIPENIIDQISSRIDIVELISGYIPLRRAGRNFKAACPFHSEKTPSFMVSPARQIYHCFGCGKGGNAFTFVMEYEKLTFQEVAEILAKKTGVQVPTASNDAARSINNMIYEVNELACKWYEKVLSSEAYIDGRRYLKKRGIKDETIKEFRLGFATRDGSGLLKFLRQRNFALRILEKAGLITSRADGGYRDLFRNRLMFPIMDIRNRVVGFGGRVLDNSLPKYINSPETAIYIKGRHLYGLNKAKEHIRDKDSLIVVEGYMDLIALKEAGIVNVASSLGTALTEEQARLIKRFTQSVVVIFDSDKAGELATLRTLDIFIKEDMNVKVVVLPKGSDPDSFIRKEGKDKFSSAVSSAMDLFDYKLRVLESMFDLKDVYGKAKIIHEMLQTLNCFRNAVIKSEYIKRLAQRLDTDEQALNTELKKIDSPSFRWANKQPVKALASKYVAAERLLLKILLEHPQCISDLVDRIKPADFQDKRFSVLVKTLLDLAKQDRFLAPNQLINHFLDSDISVLISELMSKKEPIPEDKDKVLDDCIKRIKECNHKIHMHQLHEQIGLAKDNPGELDRLLKEYNSLMKSENYNN